MSVAACTNTGHRVARPVPSSSTTAHPSTTTNPPRSSIQWSRDADPALLLGGGTTAHTAAVLAPGDIGTWLIAGARVSSAGTPSATIWTSTDGTAWQAAALPSPTGASQATAAAQYHGTRVVVGSIGLGGDRRAAVWISSRAGAPFVAAIVPTSPTTSWMTSVADGALGYFASGISGGQPAMWSSTNGEQWSESVAAEQAIGATPGARVETMTAQGPVVYAAGSVADGTSTNAAVWSSSDGIQWRQVSTAVTAFGGATHGVPGTREISSLAPLGSNGLVAVGGVETAGTWTPASWISPNGASWSEPSTQFHNRPGGALARSVSAVSLTSDTTELVAVGGNDASQRLWRSTDGLEWSSVALPATTSGSWRATMVAASARGMLVADTDPGQPHVLVRTGRGWTEPSANAAVFGPVQPAARVEGLIRHGSGGLALLVTVTRPNQSVEGAAAVSSAVLVTADGRVWSRATVASVRRAADPPTGSVSIAQFGSKWVAVGRALVRVDARLEMVAVAWVSADGRRWGPARPLTTSKPPSASASTTSVGGATADADRTAVPAAVCASPSTSTTVPVLVAVGHRGLPGGGVGALAWSSRDGEHWAQATVQPPATVAGVEEMTGCVSSPTGWIAFGATNGVGGSVPSLWKSASGLGWNLLSPSAFGAAAPAPLVSVAGRGSVWLAVGKSPWLGSGLWLSSDGGVSWQRPIATGPPWAGWNPPEFSAANFAATRPVVAGTVDGRLAVWLGTATA